MPTTYGDPHMHNLVKREDIFIDNGVLNVRFRWTKTRQTGGEPLVVPLSPVPENVLCPLVAYSRMLQLVPAPPSSPAFVLPSAAGNRPVLYSAFTKVFRQCLDGIGLNPDGFSSHSFRRGGASFAFSIGIPGEMIQTHGDWRSDAYKVYLEFSYQDKLKVSSRLSSALEKFV